jgi:hypothetical protein
LPHVEPIFYIIWPLRLHLPPNFYSLAKSRAVHGRAFLRLGTSATEAYGRNDSERNRSRCPRGSSDAPGSVSWCGSLSSTSCNNSGPRGNVLELDFGRFPSQGPHRKPRSEEPVPRERARPRNDLCKTSGSSFQYVHTCEDPVPRTKRRWRRGLSWIRVRRETNKSDLL